MSLDFILGKVFERTVAFWNYQFSILEIVLISVLLVP